MSTALGVLAGILAIVQFAPYVRDILRRTTKPERATWVIWTALSGLIFASQAAKGASVSLWMAGAQGAGNLLVLVLSFWFGVGGFTRRDKTALAMAALGLAAWVVTKEPITALLISIGVDALGASLTIIKAYRDPHSETMSTWLLSDLSGAFAALAVGRVSFPLLAYPVYVSIANTTVIGGMLLGYRRLRRLEFPPLAEPTEAVV